MKIVAQTGSTVPLDAAFEWHGRGYNLQVECAALGKQAQLAKNLQRALDIGRRRLEFVLARQRATTYADIIRRPVPGAEPQKDFGSI